MSKLKRLLGALSLVSLSIFSSCVDDTVAPEVTAFRQAQVDLLNANIAFRNAETAFLNAQTDYQLIVNSHASAMNALEQELTASNNSVLIQANLDTLELMVVQQLEALAEAAEELAQAEQELEQYLDTQGLEEAAEYLAAWNILMNGGNASLPGQPQVAAGLGIIQINRNIVGKQLELELLQLLYNGMGFNNIPHEVAIARAAVAVTDAENNLEGFEANLVAAAALVAGFDDPAAELEALLLSLSLDSIAFNDQIDDLEDQVTALTSITDDADSIIAAFENTAGAMGAPINDTGENYVENGPEYLAAQDSISDSRALAALAAADVALYNTYADILQSVYDEFFAEFADEDAIIRELRQDSIDAANALVNTDAEEEELALELAFAAYVAAERDFKRIIVDGGTPTAGDTTTYVAARRAWDGANEGDIFTPLSTPGVITDIINDVTDDTYACGTCSDPTNATFFTFALLQDARTPITGVSDGGALQDWLDATDAALLAEAYEDAVFALFNFAQFYDDASSEFAALLSYIGDLNDGDSDATAAYSTNIGSEVDDANEFFGRYEDAIDAAADVLDDATRNLAINKLTDLGYGDIVFTSQDDAAAEAAYAAGELADFQADSAKFAPFVASYLEAYTAALALVKDAQDSIDAGRIPLEFQLFTAREGRRLVEEDMQDVRDQIDALSTAVVVLTDGGFTQEVLPTVFVGFNGTSYTSVGAVAAWLFAGGSFTNARQAFEDAITTAQYALVQAQQGPVDSAGEIAKVEAQIAQMTTEVTVLQAIADEVQALLLAALAG